jgi:hypothetical protein
MTSLRVWTTMGPKGNSRGFWLVLFDSQGRAYNAGLAEKTCAGTTRGIGSTGGSPRQRISI